MRAVLKKLFFAAVFSLPIVSLAAPTSEEISAIVKEAYIYGYPMVDTYRVIHSYNVDKENPEYKGPMNSLANIARVYTPKDKAVQTPNSDTPYSFATLDLRTEPIVLILPRIEEKRYFSVQMVDLYTHNFHYLGTRATGNDGGVFMVVGPGWEGEVPENVELIRSETELVSLIYRTQLFHPDDIKNVAALQEQYKLQTLSEYLGKEPLKQPETEFIKPLSRVDEQSSLEFFNVLNFLLQFAPVHPSEIALRNHFEEIGVKPGNKIDFESMPEETKQAYRDGMADAWKEIAVAQDRVAKREIGSGDFFGTREYLKNNYLYRLMGALLGIYGNSKEEALYPGYLTDANGKELDASLHSYMLRFPMGQLPPAKAFWSLTMYSSPESLLVENEIDRYLINSSMLPGMKMDPDGSLTIYIQHKSPGAEKESNWLPAPNGPFRMALRLYLPDEAAISGKWQAPQLIVVP